MPRAEPNPAPTPAEHLSDVAGPPLPPHAAARQRRGSVGRLGCSATASASAAAACRRTATARLRGTARSRGTAPPLLAHRAIHSAAAAVAAAVCMARRVAGRRGAVARDRLLAFAAAEAYSEPTDGSLFVKPLSPPISNAGILCSNGLKFVSL